MIPNPVASTRRAIALISILVLMALSASARPSASQSEAAAEIDAMFQSAFEPDEPGAAVIVVKDGKPILRKGYGMAHMELGVKIEPDMIFRLGSITKQFTAAAILMLVEEGKLSLDDEITNFFPDYPTHGKRITIEHLLTHTSGIKSYTAMPEWRALVRKDLSVDELIAVFKDQPMDFDPGEQWSYNNSGYVLLGAIIEKLSGQSYPDFVEQRIFRPLGMKSTFYGNTERVIPRRVPGYGVTDGGYRNARYLSMTHPYAAGSVISTVDDLAIWDAALDSEKLVKQSTLRRAFQPFILKDGRSTGYGYGWMVGAYDGLESIEHGGGIFGFSTYALRLPKERVFVAVLMNKEENEQSPQELAFRAAAIAAGRPVRDPARAALAPRELDAFVGVYEDDMGRLRSVTREGEKLFLRPQGSSRVEVVPVSASELVIPGEMVRIRFDRGSDGRASGLKVIRRVGQEIVAKRTEKSMPERKQAITLDPSIYDQYVGDYELRPNFVLSVRREGNSLMAQATGQRPIEIFPSSETVFFPKVMEAEIEFVKDASGSVTGLILRQSGREISGRKAR